MSGTSSANPIVVNSDSDSDSDSYSYIDIDCDLVIVGPQGKRKRGLGADQQISKRARVVLAALLSFTGLPTEILQYIFSLCAVEDIVSLYSTCSTCRAAIQGWSFLRKVNAMATLCNLSQKCNFFRSKGDVHSWLKDAVQIL